MVGGVTLSREICCNSVEYDNETCYYGYQTLRMGATKNNFIKISRPSKLHFTDRDLWIGSMEKMFGFASN